MTMRVTFIDTSVLCNIIEIPHMDQDRGQVHNELKSRMTAGEVFIPGNHHHRNR